jgi:hypothetical protein
MRFQLLALAVALTTPAMAETTKDDLIKAAKGASVFQTYALQCKERDYPQLTDSARLAITQLLAQLSQLASGTISKVQTDELTDHVAFCRRVATIIPTSELIPVPLMSHDIAKACTDDNQVPDDNGKVETPAQCARAEKAAHDTVARQWAQLPRALQFSCVDSFRHPIGDNDFQFWRESVDCLRDTDVTEATRSWINHTIIRGEYEDAPKTEVGGK